MATFKINGVTLVKSGSVEVPISSSTSFTFSWSGLSGDSYFTYELSGYPGTRITDGGVYHFYSAAEADKFHEDYPSLSYTVVNSSGSKTIRSDVSNYTISLYGEEFEVNDEDGYEYSATFTKAYSVCTSPTSVKINGSTSNMETGSSTVSLTCSGAKAGTNNSISAYYVQYQDSSDGTSWSASDSAWTSMTNMTKAQATSGYPAATPSTGMYRKYRVKTKGTQSGYDATTWTESPVVYRVDKSPCNPPSSVYTDSELSYAPVNLIWEGASDGTNNPITGYLVQRCESADGVTFGNWIEPGTEIESSPLQVEPNEIIGQYSKFRVRAMSNLGEDYCSSWVESNILRKDMAPFKGFTDDPLIKNKTKIKAIHMTEIQNRINDLLLFNGKEVYSFTDIIAGETKLSGWKDHVEEIRLSIDTLGLSREDWILVTENKPKSDVISQIREILLTPKYS